MHLIATNIHISPALALWSWWARQVGPWVAAYDGLVEPVAQLLRPALQRHCSRASVKMMTPYANDCWGTAWVGELHSAFCSTLQWVLKRRFKFARCTAPSSTIAAGNPQSEVYMRTLPHE
jgi:hypothetical protein